MIDILYWLYGFKAVALLLLACWLLAWAVIFLILWRTGKQPLRLLQREVRAYCVRLLASWRAVLRDAKLMMLLGYATVSGLALGWAIVKFGSIGIILWVMATLVLIMAMRVLRKLWRAWR